MSKTKITTVTIKIGTRVLTDANNRLDKNVIKDLVDQIASLMDQGIEVVIVSSGAIGAGLGLLNLGKKDKSLSELQAIASVGQTHLMDAYNEYFTQKGYVAGQILLTQEDFSSRHRFLNIRYTINTLLRYKAVPVINENDSVSTEEIKCGDNDRLSSLVADLVNSDLLIMLTDVEGLYDEKGLIIPELSNITSRIKSLTKGKGCQEATGGMKTKLEAVENAMAAGIKSVIAKGRRPNVILDIVNGKKVGTSFNAQAKTIKARKRWIAFSLKAKGGIIIDEGAERALTQKNKSLLPGGIIGVVGRFKGGDLVNIITSKNKIIAKGLSNYSQDEIERIKGKKTDGIELELGYKDYDEVIHKDNLVILAKE